MDVYLGHAAGAARVVGPSGGVAMGLAQLNHLDGGGLRGVFRHLRQLPALHREPACVAPHRGERLQLCAAHRVGNRERPHRPGGLHMATGHSRHSGVLWRLARCEKQVETRRASGRNPLTPIDH